jgi:hypothetical protein
MALMARAQQAQAEAREEEAIRQIVSITHELRTQNMQAEILRGALGGAWAGLGAALIQNLDHRAEYAAAGIAIGTPLGMLISEKTGRKFLKLSLGGALVGWLIAHKPNRGAALGFLAGTGLYALNCLYEEIIFQVQIAQAQQQEHPVTQEEAHDQEAHEPHAEHNGEQTHEQPGAGERSPAQ